MYFNRKCTHVTPYETDATKRLLDLLASLSENEASLIELTYSMQVTNINLLGEFSALWSEREGGIYIGS